MSHFSVLVIGKNVEEQLAPYHEFECTGTDNQYVQEIDVTEETRAEFARHTTTRYKDPDGNLHDPFTPEGDWDKKFWRELTPEEEAKFGSTGFYQDYDAEEHGVRLYSADWKDGKPYHTKAFAWPSEGWSKVEVSDSTVRSFAEFCEDYHGHKVVPFGTQPDLSNEHKYGYTLVDEQGNVIKTINRTNPRRKWDWYSVGGRWNGYFKLKPMAVGVVGKPGLQSMNSDYTPPSADRADILMKGDIDIAGMRDEAGQNAGEQWDTADALIGHLPKALSWKEVQKLNQTGELGEDGEPKINWEAARKQYGEQPAVKALNASKDFWWEHVENFQCTREEFVQRARNRALSTFAVVKDGQWYEKGEMGWWGMVSNEQDQEMWNQQFSRLLEELPDDTLLTIVDCHI